MIKVQSKGFTLIELLITISILSALIFTGTFSYQMLANRWQEEVGTYNKTLANSKGISLLSRILHGVAPYIIIDERENKRPGLLFVGNENKLFGVTQQGLFSGKYPEIFRLTLEQQENKKYNLIYQSVSTKNQSIFTTQQEIAFEHNYLLLENIDELVFSYRGWDNLPSMSIQKEAQEQPKVTNEYSGINKQLLPLNIMTTLTINSETMMIEVDSGRDSLQHTTLYLGNNS
ncbi:conserved hypothetical protein [Pseudoalteromonas sp. 3J6]|nr:prepilin-type N-terminal cleavage/methylation domain-containing protein [Pseudoalteromonas sp. Scap03]QLE80417.1 prepilin-type N-terminal cleavage/methylation domain-containing protein [Pseudoalteromonas sp. Scap25]QLE88360.1 prepilin-type N-terminal cleavage/methylation domain-containing protein [Pseudoalteromonas sp. Scap06]CAD2223397.1 conserved hypothetical protein [Pseudoalteromonas sp. 3J6]